MSIEQARYNLNSLKNRYVLLRLTEAILIAVGVGLLVYGLTGFLIASSTTKILIAGVLGLLMLTAKILQHNLHRFSQFSLVQFVNERYPDMQESTDLLLKEDENLTVLQQLQKQKVLAQFEQVYPSIKLPHRMLQAMGIFIGCTLSYIALSGFAITPTSEKTEATPIRDQQIKAVDAPEEAVFIESLKITVTPPSYTGLQPYTPNDLGLKVPEGSQIRWTAAFSGVTTDSKIIFSGRDSVQLRKSGEHSFAIDQTILSSGFYQIQWRDALGTYRSDYYKIEMVKDQPPKVGVNNLQQFTIMRHTDKLEIDVKSTIQDEYGLNDAQIIATVSKGSGEGVKFREEKIRFSSPHDIAGKLVTADATLNLRKLGLEPGDELYFYVEATDNKKPLANRNRTETFFISLKDTASYALVSDDGLGVDLMPEYFRSQRQIIIDSEKLLKQQKEKKVTKQQFNFTSNELGYDQKVLRLRYGQFLGEEEDSGIPHGAEPEGEEAHTDEEDEKEKDPTKAFAHEHDTKNEHNLVADKKATDHKHTDPIPGEEEKEEDPLKGFVHEHDNQEEATFFMVSIRTKLKMALSVMWDAELHLRLYDPAKSLPYQYKALNLLKEISNDSRIYVHRMGFDPPPLKEEKRLTGDLSEVKTSTNQYTLDSQNSLPNIREAISTLEYLLHEQKIIITPAVKAALNHAGEEMAIIAIEQPVTSLKGLSLIRNVIDDKVPTEKLRNTLLALQVELWKALPVQPASVKKQSSSAHELDRKFLQQLEETKHE